MSPSRSWGWLCGEGDCWGVWSAVEVGSAVVAWGVWVGVGVVVAGVVGVVGVEV